MDERVAYYVQGRDKTIYFTSEGLSFVLTGKRRNEDNVLDRSAKNSASGGLRGDYLMLKEMKKKSSQKEILDFLVQGKGDFILRTWNRLSAG